jgi:hypothetical protein
MVDLLVKIGCFVTKKNILVVITFFTKTRFDCHLSQGTLTEGKGSYS